jgi:hypothetical protein
MEREGVEKEGGCGSRRCIRDAKCAIDERGSRDGDRGEKAENIERRGCDKKMEEESKLLRTLQRARMLNDATSQWG